MWLDELTSEDQACGEIPPVLREIALRKKNGQGSPNSRLGLVIEGGGIRGSVSGGSLVALSALGLNHVFDAIYGSSAGAVNGAVFLADQAAMGLTIYMEDLVSRRCVNPMRFWRIIDLDFIFDDVFRSIKPLDTNAIRQSDTNLHIGLTNVAGPTAEFLETGTFSGDILTALKATSALPLLYSKLVTIEGKEYVDGCILSPLPIRRAFEDGCTHLLVVMAGSRYRRKTPDSPVARMLTRLSIAPRHPGYARAFMDRWRVHNEVIDFMNDPSRLPPGTELHVLAPEIDTVQRATTDAEVIRSAVERSFREALVTFKCSPAEIDAMYDDMKESVREHARLAHTTF